MVNYGKYSNRDSHHNHHNLLLSFGGPKVCAKLRPGTVCAIAVRLRLRHGRAVKHRSRAAPKTAAASQAEEQDCPLVLRYVFFNGKYVEYILCIILYIWKINGSPMYIVMMRKKIGKINPGIPTARMVWCDSNQWTQRPELISQWFNQLDHGTSFTTNTDNLLFKMQHQASIPWD